MIRPTLWLIALFGLACAKQPMRVFNNTQWVESLTFSPDGSQLEYGNRALYLYLLPIGNRTALMNHSGTKTNVRICPDSLKTVAVVPFPPAQTVWAPQEYCE